MIAQKQNINCDVYKNRIGYDIRKRAKLLSASSNQQLMHNSLRRSFIQVTSKSKQSWKRKSLLNLTLHNNKISMNTTKGKQNKIYFNLSKASIQIKDSYPKIVQKQKDQIEQNCFHNVPFNYFVRMEDEDPSLNDDQAGNPFIL